MCGNTAHMYRNTKKMRSTVNQGRSQGERGKNSPLPKQKKLLQKNGVISESSIFSNKFSKKNKRKIKIKNSIFLRNFHQKMSKFPNNLCLSSKRPKMNAYFVNLFEKYGKIMHFLQFSDEKFSKISEIFSEFPINCIFSPKAQKINAWFVNFFEKYA